MDDRVWNTHDSTTNPDARLQRKPAKLSYLGHVVVVNRNGLVAAAMPTQADGTAEREVALLMLDEITGRGRHSGRTAAQSCPLTAVRKLVAWLMGADRGHQPRAWPAEKAAV